MYAFAPRGSVQEAPQDILTDEDYFPGGPGDISAPFGAQVPNCHTPLAMSMTPYPWPYYVQPQFDWARPFDVGFITLPELYVSGPYLSSEYDGLESQIPSIRKMTFPPVPPGQ